MPISSVSITDVRPTTSSVEVDFTAQGLIFSGTATLTGFVEITDGGFSPTVLASSEIDESQGRDTDSYTYSVDVSDVSAGSYTAQVVWSDDSGNSGRDSTSVTIPEQDSGGGDPDDGGGGGEPDELLLSDLSVSCEASTFDANPGDRITVSADVDGFAPANTSYEVDADLYSNGTYLKSESVAVTVNGSGGADFDVVLPEEGDYDFSVELSNLRKV